MNRLDHKGDTLSIVELKSDIELSYQKKNEYEAFRNYTDLMINKLKD